MNYLVVVMTMRNRKVKKEYHDFFELDDAKRYADFEADYLRKQQNVDFNVSIYELTNY